LQAFTSAFALFLQCVSIVGCGGDDDDSSSASAECSVPAESEMASVACKACVEASCSGDYASYCACANERSPSECSLVANGLLTCALSRCAEECRPSSGSIDDPFGDGSANGAFACYVESEGLCSAATITLDERDTYEVTCARSRGVASELCPEQGQLGCCHDGAGATCVYSGSPQTLSADSCEQAGGLWFD
jgi:hypothetical protein